MWIILWTILLLHEHRRYSRQFKSRPAYPDGSGQASGWVSLLGPSVDPAEWSAVQSIPFPFNFNGVPVTEYKVSSTGVLTFNTSAANVPGTVSLALPDPSIPDNSICIWGLNASGTNDNVSIKTFGSPGSQQEWIHFSSCTNGSIGWSYWSIVLEEGLITYTLLIKGTPLERAH